MNPDFLLADATSRLAVAVQAMEAAIVAESEGEDVGDDEFQTVRALAEALDRMQRVIEVHPDPTETPGYALFRGAGQLFAGTVLGLLWPDEEIADPYTAVLDDVLALLLDDDLDPYLLGVEARGEAQPCVPPDVLDEGEASLWRQGWVDANDQIEAEMEDEDQDGAGEE